MLIASDMRLSSILFPFKIWRSDFSVGRVYSFWMLCIHRNPSVRSFRKCEIYMLFFLNWAPRYEGVLGEWRYSSTHSLTLALDGGEWSASRPGRSTSRKRAPGFHWIRGWVCPRTFLNAVVKRKITSPRREANPRTPIVQPVAQRYTDWAITALKNILITE
jgi:hypothetical protein